MPQRQVTDKNGGKKYVDIAHPVTAEIRKAISDAVLGAYSQKMGLANQNQAGYQTEEGDFQIAASSGNATEANSMPEEILPPDEDQDMSFVPIIGQIS